MKTETHEPAWLHPIVKNLMGRTPLAVELYWSRYGRQYQGYYSLPAVEKSAAAMKAAVQAVAPKDGTGRKIHLFSSRFQWVDLCAMFGMALAGQGHRVALGYLPYARFKEVCSRFDMRLHELYTFDRLSQLQPWVRPVSLFHMRAKKRLPAELAEAVKRISDYDTQYILQTEDIDSESALYQLRYERNLFAARAVLEWLEKDPPDLVVVPNGSIQEYAIVFQVAQYLGIPVTTFEFNLNEEEMWLSQAEDVMQQNTDSLWDQRGSQPLTPDQLQKIRDLEAARMGARTFGNSARLWQDVPAHGGQEVRKQLGLDDRPVVLVATNVLGDSLTINRNLFAASMAEWIAQTVRFFAGRPEVQLVVRIHPGERLSTGPSMAEAARAGVDVLPEHIHLIGPLEKVNTYDLMELTSLGLVYTTTAGLEMAMHRIPVAVAGRTHYRGRGFTLDPASWDEYYGRIDEVISSSPPARLTQEQAELAWRYAYLFFFVYPLPFPWKLVSAKECFEKWPLERVLSPEGQARFGKTFRYLAGEPIDWKSIS